MVRRRVAFSASSASTAGSGLHGGRRDAGGRRSRSRSSRDSSTSAGDWSPPRQTDTATPGGNHGEGDSETLPPEYVLDMCGGLPEQEKGDRFHFTVDDSTWCEELAQSRDLVLHSHHRVVSLVRRQIERLLAEEATLTGALEPPGILEQPGGVLTVVREVRDVPLAMHIVTVLAPVLALVVVAALSVLSAFLGEVAIPWQDSPPEDHDETCLGRVLTAVLPAWSSPSVLGGVFIS